MTGRRLHVLVALALVLCLISPFVENAFHSTENIFQTGQDRESTLAVLLLLVELAVALAGLLVVLLSSLVEKERVTTLHGLSGFTKHCAIPLPASSPPGPLRI
jgi:hypothetical protein